MMICYYTPSVLLHFLQTNLTWMPLYKSRVSGVEDYLRFAGKKLKRRMGHKLSTGFKKKRHRPAITEPPEPFVPPFRPPCPRRRPRLI